jgi:Cu+-exporting ATPase
MKRRFWISAILTIPVFILAMAEMLRISMNLFHRKFRFGFNLFWRRRLLFGAAFLFSRRAVASVKNASPNMFTLIAIGTGAGRNLFSLFALCFPTFFPLRCRNEHTGLIAAYFEAAAVITTLVLLWTSFGIKSQKPNFERN